MVGSVSLAHSKACREALLLLHPLDAKIQRCEMDLEMEACESQNAIRMASGYRWSDSEKTGSKLPQHFADFAFRFLLNPGFIDE